MKILSSLLVFILGMQFSIVAQDTCFTRERIIEIGTKIDQLMHVDSVKSELIKSYKTENEIQNEIIERDSLYISILEEENMVLREHIDLKLGEANRKDKWFQSGFFYYVSGIVTTVLVATLL